GIFEDIVVEDTCEGGFVVEAGSNASGNTGLGDGHVFTSDIALGPGVAGFELYASCSSAAPCDSADRIPENNVITNSVAIFDDTGFLMAGASNTIDRSTAFVGSAATGLLMEAAPTLVASAAA